ncbi:transport protein particle component [Trichoderma longibrachiatum]|uniref:Transport protein particle component n=1 Tax=Trichoderma longibrachiatum ATCC 18648 TaxID=983965 RepID=A0A2T4BQ12_TRILO|nr:transport protein particle component [Trichoderma longibrachiatum ATCC 18648]
MSLSPPMQPFNSADPSASFLSTSALDFLLIELVPLAHRVTSQRDFSSPSPAATSSLSTQLSPPANHQQQQHPDNDSTAAQAQAQTSSPSVEHPAKRIDDEEHLDAVHYRLEAQGYRVGQGLVERFSRDRPRFNDTLDVIKFLCKDLWSLVFGKNIDNLKTNHRGVYVLTDNAFRPFSRMSTETGSQAVVRAQPFLWFPCGIIRGALAALGISATVQAEVNELPAAIFQIKTVVAKPQ